MLLNLGYLQINTVSAVVFYALFKVLFILKINEYSKTPRLYRQC